LQKADQSKYQAAKTKYKPLFGGKVLQNKTAALGCFLTAPRGCWDICSGVSSLSWRSAWCANDRSADGGRHVLVTTCHLFWRHNFLSTRILVYRSLT